MIDTKPSANPVNKDFLSALYISRARELDFGIMRYNLSDKSLELASRLPRVYCLALASIMGDATMGSPSTAAMWLNRGIKYWP
ncbi:possible Alanine racemase [Prochlorococcus marinus str. MIT 9313]|uniref:Possible Alanine racemase n=1 Tax=Prochlorococcus marinus (strain MIT 9313) TaxID=74547 RepID=Q7TUK4_PROMM|nr:possible Alanine racemase [Prochlorococcus marinus str. MIT 9313]